MSDARVAEGRERAPAPIAEMSNKQLAYLVTRLALGVSIFMHGAVRIPRLNEFAAETSDHFAGTILAGFPSLASGYLVPFVEVACGILILAGGRYIRWGLASGALLMGFLMFGSAIIEQWDWVMAQLVHLALFYLLLMNPYTPGPGSVAQAGTGDGRRTRSNM